MAPPDLLQFASALADLHLTMHQFCALTTLRATGPSTSISIARRFGLSGAALTSILDVLTDRGLIERAPHANRRERLSALTPVGISLLDSLFIDSYENTPPASDETKPLPISRAA
jgi:DNA-binding MarR family transcriptional regulator